jgi:hypothetical protein
VVIVEPYSDFKVRARDRVSASDFKVRVRVRVRVSALDFEIRIRVRVRVGQP